MKKKPNNKLVIKSTKWRLFGHVVLILLPILALAIFFDLKVRAQVKIKASENFNSVLRILSSQHEQYLHDGQQLLKVIAHDNDIIEHNIPECNQFLEELKQDYSFYANIYLLDTNGQNICGTGFRPNSIVNVSLFREYFAEVVRSQKFTISDYSIGIVSRRPVIILAQPVFDADKNLNGVIVASMDLEWINKSISEFNLPSNRSLLILDKTGNILGGFWTEEKLIGQSIAQTELFKNISSLSANGTFISDELDGVQKVFVSSKLSGLPSNYPVYVLLGLPKKDLDAVTIAFNNNQLATWTLALMLFFLIMYFILNHYSHLANEAASCPTKGKIKKR